MYTRGLGREICNTTSSRSTVGVAVSTPKEPRARFEFVDVATGEPVDPAPKTRAESDGAAPTGRIVADFDGVQVEVEDEDLLGSEGEHPRERTFGFDVEGPEPDYATRAKMRADEMRARRARVTKAAKKGRGGAKKPRLFRETFDSAAQAAKDFYDANEMFFDYVPDPGDGLREWADGIDVRTGKATTRRLVHTAVGRRILGERQGAPQIRAALRWIFNQAPGRRWDAVPWVELDRLEEALLPLYEPPSWREAGVAGIYWRPIVGAPTPDQLEQLDAESREQLAQWEGAEELRLALADLREAYADNGDCLSPAKQAIVERRIEEWTRWAGDPERIPPYACEPDPATGGYTCNYPSVAGELRELRDACERGYDPDWAEPEGRAAAPGYPDLSSAPPDPYVGAEGEGREDEGLEAWGDADELEPELGRADFASEGFDAGAVPWETAPAHGPDEDFGVPPWEADSPPEDAALPDIGPEPDDPFVRPGEMTVHSRPVRAVLRQLADDGRAYGAPREAVVETREHAGVLYQREYRKCGKRNPKTGQPWCWCFGAWPNSGHGPYWYAYWRDETTGRRRSTYIGKGFEILD